MPFIRHLNSESSRAVIAKMKTIFSEHGVPELLFTDGGPCYSSREFRDFAKSWGIRHVISSPHYPQSNGFVERAIQTIKLTMKKARRTGTDPELALLCVRATPLDARVGSPADLLYGRPLRTNLPLKTRGSEDVVSALRFRQEQQKLYYDKSAKDRPDLQIGQTVGLQDPNSLRWTEAKVIQKCPEPRSYVVEAQGGSQFRRNQRFLKDITPVTPGLIQSDHNGDSSLKPSTSVDDGITPQLSRERPPLSPVSSKRRVTCSNAPIETTGSIRPPRFTRRPRRLIESM